MAKQDFNEVLQLEPNNKAAKDQLKTVLMKIKQLNDIERKKYSELMSSLLIYFVVGLKQCRRILWFEIYFKFFGSLQNDCKSAMHLNFLR